jgi:anti-sigma factor RsiW
MKCRDLLKQLNDYVDGDIDPSICEHLEEHLEECDPCRGVVDTMRKTITLYREETEIELPVEFHNRLHAALREKWRRTHDEGADAP